MDVQERFEQDSAKMEEVVDVFNPYYESVDDQERLNILSLAIDVFASVNDRCKDDFDALKCAVRGDEATWVRAELAMDLIRLHAHLGGYPAKVIQHLRIFLGELEKALRGELIHNESLVTLPDRTVAEERLHSILPVGNVYQELAWQLSKSAGQIVNAEGVFNWLRLGISDCGAPLLFRLMPQMVEVLIDDQIVRAEASKITHQRLEAQEV